ncbi:hypothetical protein [Rhizobium aegyptiacum]|uniref:hypothetical protein n=1 Tax=Rhizobium aegyptiacum TaxID=1764550 RepID=UPI0007E58E86|nr:hypothetical protein [Rhizobium aegyptiacum]
MKRWSVRQLGLLLLATFLVAGIGLSVAQASGMVAKMATMSEMAVSDQGDCQDCPDQPGGKRIAFIDTMQETAIDGRLAVSPEEE